MLRLSHPTRVRGLKRAIGIEIRLGFVAPHTGAWIETPKARYPPIAPMSHPTRVRGLKQTNLISRLTRGGRTPHGCVD